MKLKSLRVAFVFGALLVADAGLAADGVGEKTGGANCVAVSSEGADQVFDKESSAKDSQKSKAAAATTTTDEAKK